jgi:AAA domain
MNSQINLLHLKIGAHAMKLSDKTASKAHRVMVFGPPKSGKTQLVGELSSKFNLLWVDLENGIDSLLKLPDSCKERIEVISIPDTRSYPIGIETCIKMVRGSKGRVCELHGKWNCPICTKDSGAFIDVELNTLPLDTIVVFDSITQLTNSAISYITKNQPEDYKLNYDDWGNLGKLMDMFLSHVQQALFNVVCISHETEVEMEDGKNKLVPTGGTRNFSRNVAKYFDEVIYCEVKNKKHVAASSTTYNSNILTGSRHGISLENFPGNASLVPIFTGELNTSSQNTPANKAAIDLTALADSLKFAKQSIKT